MQLFDFEKTTARTTYRKRALQEYGAFCAICGYGAEVKMLDVHHIDEDRTNGQLENLEVRCIWCHAVETRGVKWHMWNGSDFSKTGRTKILVDEQAYNQLLLDKQRLDTLDKLSEIHNGQWGTIVLDKETPPQVKIREILDNLKKV